jgi:hypothetical protein
LIDDNLIPSLGNGNDDAVDTNVLDSRPTFENEFNGIMEIMEQDPVPDNHDAVDNNDLDSSPTISENSFSSSQIPVDELRGSRSISIDDSMESILSFDTACEEVIEILGWKSANDSQIEVLRTLIVERKHVIWGAPCNAGKSFAYLAPAILSYLGLLGLNRKKTTNSTHHACYHSYVTFCTYFDQFI